MNLTNLLMQVRAYLAAEWERLQGADGAGLAVLAVVGVVGLWLLWQGTAWLARWGAQAPTPTGRGTGNGGWPGGTAMRRQAKRLARQGDAREAGHLFEMVGDLDRAAAQYVRARAYAEAAAVHERARHWVRAAGLYERAGDLPRAAETLLQANEYRQAAALFRKAGRDLRAAEAMERGRDYAEAAGLYERAGALEKAAALYERAGAFAAGADALERHLLARYGGGRGEHSAAGTLPPEGAAALQKCATLFRLGRQPARAAKALAHWGATSEAARLYLEAGEPRQALELHRAAGQLKEAMDICQLIGAHTEFHAIRAERLARAGKAREAAEAWERAGEPDRAAEIYRGLREWTKAGELYARAGAQDAAAEMFEVVEQWPQAAAAYAAARRFPEASQCYQRAGMPREAAAVLAEAGDFYAAGLLMAETGAVEEAIALLQRMPPDSPQYLKGGLAMARLLLESGMVQPALLRLRALAGQPGWSGTMAEINYLLGRAHEALERPEEALAHYEQVVAERVDYEDAGARAAALRQRAQRAAAESTVLLGPAGVPARYRVERELGRGGMGIVYEAQDQVLMRPVALKVPAPAIQASPGARERFLREARIAAGLRHPNIVTIYDAGETEAALYIAMALVEGITLEAYLRQGGPLPPDELLGLVRQICAGLGHAHAHGIVHADVKPANMLVDTMGTVHLTDFGLARAWEGSHATTLEARGTPYYIAPEQVRGEALDTRADIYSLGCTVYRMVTGAPPFTKGDVLYAHLHEEPAPVRAKNPDAPAKLETAIARCLAKSPEDRFPSVAHLLNALEAAFPPTPPPTPARGAGRSPR